MPEEETASLIRSLSLQASCIPIDRYLKDMCEYGYEESSFFRHRLARKDIAIHCVL